MEYTFIIKTFERRKCLHRILASIEKEFGNNSRIIIADDSRSNSKKEIENKFKKIIEEYIVLTYDIGPSEGRHAALEKVKTKYFVLCDDDFIFDKKIDIKKLINRMEDQKIDILGGNFININSLFFRVINFLRSCMRKKYNFSLLKSRCISTFYGTISEDGRIFYEDNFHKIFPGSKIKHVDFTNNFFIGKTSKILQSGGWKGLSHIGPEHLEFFHRMQKKGIIVGYDEDLYILHNQIFKISYLLKRFRNKKIPTKKLFPTK